MLVNAAYDSRVAMFDDLTAADLLKNISPQEVLVILVGAAGHVFGRAAVYTRRSGADVLSREHIEAHVDAVIDVLFDGLVRRS